jgi:hypothetical protein
MTMMNAKTPDANTSYRDTQGHGGSILEFPLKPRKPNLKDEKRTAMGPITSHCFFWVLFL